MPYIAFLTIEPYHYMLLYFSCFEDKIFHLTSSDRQKNLFYNAVTLPKSITIASSL